MSATPAPTPAPTPAQSGGTPFNDPRKKYVYIDDLAREIVLSLDSGTATIAGTGLVELTTQTGVISKPSRFKPRVAYWEAVDRSKRKAIVCNIGGALYTGGPSVLDLGGVPGRFTGRRGEKATY